MLEDPVFIQALYNTLYFTAVATAIGVPLAIGIALLLNEKFHGRTFARVCLLLPWATPPVVVAGMFKWMMDAAYGIINYFLLITGVLTERISFFSSMEFALNGLIVIFTWKMAPVFTIILLSALQNRPIEVLESAKVYGAGVFERFRCVTLPYLKNTLIIIIVLSILLTLIFNFDLVISITSGGPGYATYTSYFYSYITTFWFLNAGYGAAVAYVVMFICLASSLVVLRLGQRR